MTRGVISVASHHRPSCAPEPITGGLFQIVLGTRLFVGYRHLRLRRSYATFFGENLSWDIRLVVWFKFKLYRTKVTFAVTQVKV
jgi:hypothetical protein